MSPNLVECYLTESYPAARIAHITETHGKEGGIQSYFLAVTKIAGLAVAAMEKIVTTPRLRLTLLEFSAAESNDVEYVRIVRSSPEATSWSIAGVHKTTSEAQELIKTMLPSQEGEGTAYRITYAVHRLLQPASSNREVIASTAEPKQDSEIIGLVMLKPESAVPLHDHITKKTDQATGHLRLEIGYLFLPTAWGNGFATEACGALLEACRRSTSFFAPFKSLYVEAVVGPGNPASMKVLEKAGLKQVGLNEWNGEAVFLAGALRDPVVWVYGIRVF